MQFRSFAASTLLLLATAVLRASPQAQFDEGIQKGHLPPFTGDTRTAAVADVDGDGDLDLIIGPMGAQNLLWINDGQGSFTDETAFRLPVDTDHSNVIEAADVDGDGDLDFACANTTQDRLYRNDGTGRFSDVTASALPVRPELTGSLEFGDLDGDGDQDLVLCWPGTSIFFNGGAMVYRNDGLGRYTDVTAQVLPPSPAMSQDLVVEDFDGDNDLDILLANNGPHMLFLNDGAGSFSLSSVPLPAAPTLGVYMVAGDLDNDADVDVIFATVFGALTRWLNDGTGAFTATATGWITPPQSSSRALGLLDADLDGDLDFVVGDEQENAPDNLYLNDGTANFFRATSGWVSEPTTWTRGITIGDLDGNGAPDVLALGILHDRLLLNGGNANFLEASRPRIVMGQGRPVALAVGDVDGDADIDMLAVDDDQNIAERLFRNDGDGRFEHDPAATPLVIESSRAVAMGDLNGDGHPDAVLGSFGRNNLLLNDGTGGFAVGTTLVRMFDDTRSVVLGDVDRDGDLDLFVANDEPNRLELNDGFGSFTEAPAGFLPTLDDSTLDAAMADVDGDGDLDIVVANRPQGPGSPGEDRLYLNDGSGRMMDATATHMPADATETRALIMADLDGDGDPDIYLAKGRGAGIDLPDVILMNDGTGQFATPPVPVLPQHAEVSRSVVAGDVDRDGDFDLVVGTDSRMRFYLNQGGGTFSEVPARLPMTEGIVTPRHLADMDRDGDADLVATIQGGSPVVYANLHHQIRAQRVARLGAAFELCFDAKPGYANADHMAVPTMGWALARTPQPFPPFGSFLMAPNALLDLLPWVTIPQSSGRGTYRLEVPLDTAYLGFTFHVQALIVDLAMVDSSLTGATIDTIRW